MSMRSRTLSSLSAADREAMQAINARWGSDINAHRDFVVRTYSELVSRTSNERIRVVRDHAYGSHPRQVLDLFADAAAAPGDGRPVVLFVHGGAFIRGKKSANGHVYDNVCHWFAHQGFVAINMEYRLAADAPYPGGAQDVAAAFGAVQALAPQFGGDARRIFLMGHSAGGTHVATAVFDPAFGTPVVPAGVVLVSARLAADVRPGNPNANGVRAYFGEDDSLYAQRSPTTHAARSQVPLMVAIAEFENPYLDSYGAEFFARAALARTRPPRFVQMPGHNHTSIVAHFNSGEDTLGPEIVDFIQNAIQQPPETPA